MKKVTIIAEALLRERIVELVRASGASGFTITAVEGEGSRGVRASEWEGRNVKIESVVPPSVAESLMQAVAERYFENFAVIVYTSDVEVLRGSKYLGRES